MNTHHIYSHFLDSIGMVYSIMDDGSKSYYDKDDRYTFVMTVELPDIPQEEAVKAGVKAIDDKIAAQQLEITKLLEKKSQLLSITHQEES